MKAFTILLNLSSGFTGSNGYARILSYSLDEGHQNFMVGQWENNLVFRLKVDGRTKPVHFETDDIFKKGERTSLAIIFDGTRLFTYQDGKKTKERMIGPLTFSGWDKSYPLVIGSEANGKFPWEGSIYSAAIFDRALTREEIKEAQHGNGLIIPLVGYDFVACEGGIVKDSGEGIQADLMIPVHFNPYKRTVLENPSAEWRGLRRNFKDILVNVAGFIPLGFLFAGYLRYKGCGSVAVALLAVATGFGISLFIEVLQAFLPSRSSDMMDLIANTIGTMIGCLFLVLSKFGIGAGLLER